MIWMCSICGYAYDGEDFLKEEDYVCPLCDSGKENFFQRDLPSEIITATNDYFENTIEEQ